MRPVSGANPTGEHIITKLHHLYALPSPGGGCEVGRKRPWKQVVGSTDPTM
jgi:hypothetical protein